MKAVRLSVWFLLLGYWSVAAYITHSPMPRVIGREIGDKWAHFLGYGLLSGLLYLAIWSIRPTWRWTPLLIIAIAMLYGAIDELTQPPFGRTADIRDWMADLAGALTATACMAVAQWGMARLTSVATPHAGTLAAENG